MEKPKRDRRGRRPAYAPPQWSARTYVRVNPAQIALLRFLLESHGHLGLMTVLDRHAAVLKLSYSPDCEREMQDFLEEVRGVVTTLESTLPTPPPATP